MRQKITRKKVFINYFLNVICHVFFFYFFREGDDCRVPDAIQVDWRAAGGIVTGIYHSVASSCCKLLSLKDIRLGFARMNE